VIDPDQAHRQAIAVFHPGLSAELVHLASAAQARHARLRASAERCRPIPCSPAPQAPGAAPMSVCGLWLSAQRLCAVIIEDSGQARTPLTTDYTPEACASLLAWLATSEVHTVVLSERAQGLIAQAHAAHLRVELVAHQLLEAIRGAAGLIHRAPCHSAALLARWHFTPGLREHLRELRAPDLPAQQHTLF
jgi:hypothetical protein